MKNILIALLGLVASHVALAEEPGHTGWWFDIGLGPVSLSSGSNAPVSGNGSWLDGAIGRRLNNHWLMGLEFGGAATSASDTNYNDFGGVLTHTMLAVRYLPGVDHGWVWGLGAGQANYSDGVIGLYSGSGWAGNAAVGYDWKLGHSGHFEVVLNLEQGHISLDSPLSGHFNYTAVALSAHIAHF
jgi:hypothetical protein